MFQRITIAGRLGRDPSLRQTAEGISVCDFSVAVNQRYSREGEKCSQVVWFRVTCWGRLAEICKDHTRRGSLVLIDGKLEPDSETGSPRIWMRDGQPRANFDLVAREVQFLGRNE